MKKQILLLIMIFLLGTSSFCIPGDLGLLDFDVVSDAVYSSSWNGKDEIAPSQNAVYDKIEAIDPTSGANAGSFTDLDCTTFATPYGATTVVAASGGDYTDLSDAVDDASAGDTILVYPGIYTDTITVAVNNLSIIALGSPFNTTLTQIDANLIDFGATTGGRIINFNLNLSAPTTAIAAVQGSTGSFQVRMCKSTVTCAQNLSQADQPMIGQVTGSGTLAFNLGQVIYSHTGTTATGLKIPFKAASGGAVKLYDLKNIDINGSGSAIATAVGISTGTGYIHASGCIIDVDDDTATFTVGMGYLTSGSSILNEFLGNIVHVHAADNNAYGIYTSDATVISNLNHIHIECSGAGNAYSFVETGTGEINSTGDAITAASGYSGNVNMVSSEANGGLTVSETLRAAMNSSITKTDNYTVTTADLGKTLVMNSASDKTFTLLSVDGDDIGARLRFVKLGAGKLTIDAADSDTIGDSGAGDTVYCGDTGKAVITIELISATQWAIMSIVNEPSESWITTD